MLALSPLAACYFAAKVVGRGLASPGLRWRLPGSLPWLVPFIAAWSLGELTGYVAGVFRTNRPHGPDAATSASTRAQAAADQARDGSQS